jgi:phage terminase small subunit
MAALKNDRHERFAQGLAKGLSADEAYREAGYKPNRGNATRLKANENVAARIEEIRNAGALRAEVSVQRVLQELGRIGFADLRQAFDEDGNLKPVEKWGDDFAAAVASVEVVSQGAAGAVERVHKIRFWDKNSALEKIAKHLGMFTERLDLTSSDGSMSPKGLDASGLSDAALKELMDARRKSEADEG